MSSKTGKRLEGTAHLAQSIADILTTPLGTRVMRRDYGSRLFELVDQPGNIGNVMLIRAATALALKKWEPRLAVSKVGVSGKFSDGTLTIAISGQRLDTGTKSAVSISVPYN